MSLPHSVDFFVTKDCNLNCNHCWGSHVPDYVPAPLAKRIEMIDIACTYGVRKSVFTGGEPLVYSDLPALLAHAKEKGMETLLFTNAAHMPRLAPGVLPYVDYISLSLDEPLEGVTIRGQEQVRAAMETLELLKTRYTGKKVQVLTVVQKQNVAYLDRIGDILKERTEGLNFHWKLNFYQPIGRFNEACLLDYDAFESSSRKIRERFEGELKVFYSVKRHDKGYIFIFPDGFIYTTIGDKYLLLGNIFVPKTWNQPELDNIEREMAKRTKDRKPLVLNLIRHAECEVNRDYGNLPPESKIILGRHAWSMLTPNGKLQAQKIGRRFKSEQVSFDMIASGATIRTIHTARCILEELVDQAVLYKALSRIEVRSALDEIYQGEWEGEKSQVVRPPAVMDEINRLCWTHRPPGGESIEEVCIRANNYVEAEVFPRKVQNVALVTSGNVIKGLLTGLLDLPKGKAHKIDIDNASLTKLMFQDREWRQLVINDTSHL